MGIKRSVDTINTDVKAPMPGKVIQILVKEGDSIEKGNGILILEAMKMENVLKAESDCVIKKILVKTGDSVEKNQILIELDA
jgi:biotin carboxyl carrier protein